MGARAVITTGATLSEPSWPADSWIESWVMDTVSNIFVLPSMNLTSVFARPKGQEEYRPEGQMLQRGLLDWFKRSLIQLVQDQGEVPGGYAPPAFGSVSVETVQEMSEIFVLADVEG